MNRFLSRISLFCGQHCVLCLQLQGSKVFFFFSSSTVQALVDTDWKKWCGSFWNIATLLGGHIHRLDGDCILSFKHGLGFHYYHMQSSISFTCTHFLQMHPIYTYSLFRGCSSLEFFHILTVFGNFQCYIPLWPILKLLSITVYAALTWHNISVTYMISSKWSACAEHHSTACICNKYLNYLQDGTSDTTCNWRQPVLARNPILSLIDARAPMFLSEPVVSIDQILPDTYVVARCH